MLRAFKNRAPFFVRYVVESDGPAAVAARQAVDPTACLGAGVMCLLVVAMSCAPAWLAASRRWGKFRVWLVVSGAALACNVLFLIPLREWEGERGGRGVWL